MDILVTYAINHKYQHTYVTMHSERIHFDGSAAVNYTAADVLNKIIWLVCSEHPDVKAGDISLINYWEV